jgi:hypothetical protein
MRAAQSIVRELLELAVDEANKEDLLNWQRYIERIAAIYNQLASSTISAAQAGARIIEWNLTTAVSRRSRSQRSSSTTTNLIRTMVKHFYSSDLDTMSVNIGDVICTVSRNHKTPTP